MKLGTKIDNYKKFRFYLFLENCILSFVTYDVIRFETIENNIIFDKFISLYMKIINMKKHEKKANESFFMLN